MRMGRIPDAGVAVLEDLEHLSAEVLWTTVKKGRPLADSYVQHTRECRDCREFVEEFSTEARGAGYSFPELLPQTARS
jgi:hypothetical protein